MPPSRNVDAASRAQRLLERLNVTAVPVPVEKIAKDLGASIRFSPLDAELSGMIYLKDDRPIIGVNALHHPNRQRFTIAHEIGHLELHRDMIAREVHVDKEFRVGMSPLHRDGKSALGTELVEIQANQFASALLIPTDFLAKALAAWRYDIDNSRPVEELAKKLRVSRQALEYRIRNVL
jgi:Zn-dependent peptidase ImmA (M78 family)